MAEGKRTAMTTTGGSLKKDKKPKTIPPTPRFNLVLHESNDKTCPEYSYSELVRSRRPAEPAAPILPSPAEAAAAGEEDPFGDDDGDDKLKALAKKFEDKYGPTLGKKHRKKLGRLEDYIDLGMGYDENDPFIDNTDAYDELVPSTLTTQLGGFYINTGKLNFKEVNTESSDDEILDTAAKKRRRRLKDLDKDGKRRKRLGKDAEAGPKKRGRKPLDKSDRWNKKGVKQPTVAALLMHHKAQMQANAAAAAAAASSSNVVANGAGQAGASVVGLADSNNPKSSVADAIESVINASRDADSNDCGMNAGTGSSDSEIATGIAASEYDDEELKLPENLPADLDGHIRQIKEAALRSEDGKCKFFSGDVNDMLLNIELKSRELTCSQRTTVFAHLAKHLPCTKETLMKRAKKLRLDQEANRLKKLMEKLKEAVDMEMPALFEKFSQDCLENPNYREECHSSDEEEEEIFSDKSSQEGEQATNSRLMRKNFVWNDECRKRLCDVVRVKMKCYEVSKLRSQSAEDYLRHFLVSEVKQLWPKGWMKARLLYKESKSSHSYLTSRPRKSFSGISIKKSYPPAASVSDQINKTLLSNGVVQALSPPLAATAPGPSPTPVVVSVGSSPRLSGKNSPVSNPSVEYCRQVTISVVTTTTTTSAASNASLSVTPALPSGTTVTATAGTSLPSSSPIATSTAAPASCVSSTTMAEGFAIRLPAHSLPLPEASVSVAAAVNPVSTVPVQKPAEAVSFIPVSVPVNTTINSPVPSVSISPHSVVVHHSLPQKPVSVHHPSVSKSMESSSPPSPVIKHHVDKSAAVYLPRATTSVDSITVSSLLKQANVAGSGGNPGESARTMGNVGGSSPMASGGNAGNSALSGAAMASSRKFSLLDFAEPVHMSVDTPSGNDVLSQIIHASLADFPNSGNNKALSGSVTLSASSSEHPVSSSSMKMSSNSLVRVQSKPASPSVITSVSSSQSYKDAQKLMNYKSQVSILKNPSPSSAIKSESGVVHQFPAKVELPRPPSSGNSAPSKGLTCTLNAQHNTQVLHQNKASYNLHAQDISPPKASFTSVQSTFEFNEAFERTLQGKEGVNLAHQGVLHSSNSYSSLPNPSVLYRKDTPADVLLQSSYGRKEASVYKETLCDQPLNFSTSRTGPPSSSPLVVVPPSVSCSSPGVGGYSSRISPVPGVVYTSPHKEGIKPHVATKPAHVPGRHPGLPPTTYGSTMSNSSVRHASDAHYWGKDVLSMAVASALFGPEGSSSSSPSAYPTSSVAVAAPTPRPLSHTTTSSIVPCSSSSLANHLVYSSGSGGHAAKHATNRFQQSYDYNPAQQALNPAWRTSPTTSNSCPPSPPTTMSAIYSRHYAKMLPPVTSSPSPSLPLPTFTPALKLSNTAKSNAMLQQPPYQPSRDPGISPTSYTRDQGSSY